MPDILPDKLTFDIGTVFEPDDYLPFYSDFLTEERTNKEVEFLLSVL